MNSSPMKGSGSKTAKPRKSSLNLLESFFTFRKAQNSLSTRSTGFYRLIPWIFLASGICLFIGLYVPLYDMSTLGVFKDKVSILGLIQELFKDQEYLLVGIIGLFSITIPILKLLASDYVWRAKPLEEKAIQNTIKTIDLLGKWSMLDVFVIAFIVFTVKTIVFTNISIEIGIYFFFASVLGSLLGTFLLKNAIHTATDPAPETGTK